MSPIHLGAMSVSTPDWAAAAAVFDARRAIICPGLLDQARVAQLNRFGDAGRFVPEPVEGLGHRHVEQARAIGGAIALLLRRVELYRWLERVTGCGPIGDVGGRVVEARANSDDGLSWHDDREPGRRLAITIALGATSYEGGLFELRRQRSKEVLMRFQHDQPGTALIFTVSPDYEHRVLPVTAGGPRRVFAGWFVS